MRKKRRIGIALAICGLSFSTLPFLMNSSVVGHSLPEGSLDIVFSNGSALEDIRVARTFEEKKTGLQGVSPVEHAMLFLWERPEHLVFWMKDTPEPLTVIFFDPDYSVTGITDMDPYSLEIHESPGKALGAIEIPHEVTASLGIEEGMEFEIRKANSRESQN